MRPRIACQRRTASSGVVRLAERLAVELEHRVAAQHQRPVGDLAGDGGALELGEPQRQVGRARRPVTCDSSTPGDHDRRLDAGRLQRGEAGGGGGGEHERGHGPDALQPVRLRRGRLPFPGARRTPATPHGGSPSIQQPDYWWYRARSEMLRTVLGPVRRVRPSALLDVGSADGPSVGWLTAPHKVSLDLDPRGLRPPVGVCGSVLALPFADASFEVVSAFDVVEHCEPGGRRPRASSTGCSSRAAGCCCPCRRTSGRGPTTTSPTATTAATPGRGRSAARRGRPGSRCCRATYGFAARVPRLRRPSGPSRGVRHRLAPARRTRTGRRRRRPRRWAAASSGCCCGLCRLDERVLARRDLPFGSSVFLAAVKR